MDRAGNPIAAAQRARWLAELAEAVEQAEQLARALGEVEGSSAEAMEVQQRLEAVRLEVAALRRGRQGASRKDIDPLWSSLRPWTGRKD